MDSTGTLLAGTTIVVNQQLSVGVTRPKVAFGKAVRARRHALGLSQEQLAEKADLHWTYIGRIERRERNVSLLNIVKTARALGTTASELLERMM